SMYAGRVPPSRYCESFRRSPAFHTCSSDLGCSGSTSACLASRRKSGSSMVNGLLRNGSSSGLATTMAGAARRRVMRAASPNGGSRSSNRFLRRASLRAGARRALPPGQRILYLFADAPAGVFTIHSARQELVVVRMVVANGGGDRGEQGALFQFATGLASAHAPAASGSGMCGGGARLSRRASREKGQNPPGHLLHQFLVLPGAQLGGACQRLGAVVRIQGALGLGFLDGGTLHQNALPLVAPARPAEAHHRGRLAAVPGGAARQCRVTGRQKLEVAHPGAWQAERLFRLHEEHAALGEFGA